MSVRQKPSCRVRFPFLYNILLLPCTNIAIRFHQPRWIKNITPDRIIIVPISRNIQQRQIIRGSKERHPLFASPIQQIHRLRRKRIPQKTIQLCRTLYRHRQMETEIIPPLAHQFILLLITHPLLKMEPYRRLRLPVLYLLNQQMQHPLLVLIAFFTHLFIQPRSPPVIPALDTLRRRQRNSLPLQAFKQLEQFNKQIRRHLYILQPFRQKLI